MSDPLRAASAAAAPPPRGVKAIALADELGAYRTMLLIRRFEEKAGQLYGMGDIGGFCHLSIGQEAAVTGLHMAARPDDQVIANYRSHGHMLARGVDARALMAELLGRGSGVSKGKGGSMHMFSRQANFFGGHGVDGANVPLGAGIALANRYRGEDKVCWCFFGAAASDLGQVHESFNMAASWRLPIVFVIENNSHAPGEVTGPNAKQQDLSQRGRPFSVPGWQVDGMDVRAVCDAGVRAAQWVRGGQGPFILELLTCRFRGHAMPDPVKSSAKDEAQSAQAAADPIAQSHMRLIASGISEQDLRDIDKQVRALVTEAVKYAKAQPLPDAADLDRHVTAAATGVAS